MSSTIEWNFLQLPYRRARLFGGQAACSRDSLLSIKAIILFRYIPIFPAAASMQLSLLHYKEVICALSGKGMVELEMSGEGLGLHPLDS